MNLVANKPTDWKVRVLGPHVWFDAAKAAKKDAKDKEETDQFGAEARPVVLMPGVKVRAADVTQYVSPAAVQSRSHRGHRPLAQGTADGRQHV